VKEAIDMCSIQVDMQINVCTYEEDRGRATGGDGLHTHTNTHTHTHTHTHIPARTRVLGADSRPGCALALAALIIATVCLNEYVAVSPMGAT
jgi:hypothetical protein